MRKLVLTTILAVAFAAPGFAQSSQSAPQPGLPPGAGYMAPNAQPPRDTGAVQTTTVPSATPMAMDAAPAPRMTRHSRRMHHHHRHMRHHHVSHATMAPAPAAQ